MKPEELTQKIAQRLEQWQKAQQNQTSGYEYEKSFTELWQQLGKEVFQSSLGDEQYDKNYKKNQEQLGRNHHRQKAPPGPMPQWFSSVQLFAGDYGLPGL